jgi:uncharacterized damage-inducible protein DinB
MAEFNKYEQLFDGGEYLPPHEILSGITLEYAIKKVTPAMNTIYDELWHVTNWQDIVLNDDKTKYEKWKNEQILPAEQAKTQAEFDLLADEFCKGIEKAISISKDTSRSSVKLDYGITVAESLDILATHNAYHMAKIVALRQIMGIWPPNKQKKD